MKVVLVPMTPRDGKPPQLTERAERAIIELHAALREVENRFERVSVRYDGRVDAHGAWSAGSGHYRGEVEP